MRSTTKLLGSVVASFFILSCDNDSNEPQAELSAYAKNFLTLKMGSLSSNSMASAAGFTNTANQSFRRLSSEANLAGGRTREDSTKTDPDTTYFPSPWVTCAVITTTVNDDNSITTQYDYGDGCEEGSDYYKYFIHGKYSYTYRYVNERVGSKYLDTYYGSHTLQNYGGRYYWENDTTSWTSNGSSTYSGNSEYDTLSQTFKGNYQYQGNDVYTYNGVTYSYQVEGKGSYNENGSIQEKNDYTYTTPDYSYSTYIIEPLVMRYDCYANAARESLDWCFMPVYVSGREFISYQQNGAEGSFEIDYGDGQCDSIVTIIENGKRIQVDLYAWARPL